MYLRICNDKVLFQHKRLLGHSVLLRPAVHLSCSKNTHSCLCLVSHRALVHKLSFRGTGNLLRVGTETCLWLLFFRGDNTYLSFKGIKLPKVGGTAIYGYTLSPSIPTQTYPLAGAQLEISRGKGCDHK